ncbi:endoribonuclease ysh1 [Ascosphaera pollenicola]|nr:endoribonuclease ysh1 [Ascosphaera pollenicola]
MSTHRNSTPGASTEDLSPGNPVRPVRSLRRHRSYQSLTSHPSFTKNNSTKRRNNRSRPPIPEFDGAPDQDGDPGAMDMYAPEPYAKAATRQTTMRPARGSITGYSAPRMTRANTATNTSGRASADHVGNPREPLSILTTRPTRSRSNSDTVTNGSPSASLKRMSASRKSLPFVAKRTGLDVILREGPSREKHGLEDALTELRYIILTTGIDADGDGMSPNRIYIWLILLNTPLLSTDEYLGLVHRGRSPAYTKIRNDTFRTLATDPLFKRRVTEASLIRLLNATAWKLQDLKDEENAKGQSQREQQRSPPSDRPAGSSGGASSFAGSNTNLSFSPSETAIYVQGMNVLSAPFLYTSRSEVEAYALFTHFITHECPGYIRGAMDGVHKGLKLMDRCLEVIDPELAAHLFSKGLQAEIYAFPSMVTLCACTPPLPEVLHLWDFLFAYGPHLNILCIVAQLLRMRDMLLASEK